MMQTLANDMSSQKLQVILFTGAALILVLLTENSRIPVDDPTTHLELTMIHEVMVLDYCGIDLGLINYTSYLKLWVSGVFFVSVVQQGRTGNQAIDFGLMLISLFAVALIVGIIESVMARLRMQKVSFLTTSAAVLAILSLIIPVR